MKEGGEDCSLAGNRKYNPCVELMGCTREFHGPGGTAAVLTYRRMG